MPKFDFSKLKDKKKKGKKGAGPSDEKGMLAKMFNKKEK